MTVFAFTCNCCYAQLYTLRQYPIKKEAAVTAGSAINYCGRMDTININIYKPVGDNNLKRPVAVFAHGGAFSSAINAGDSDMTVFAQEFARRGYVGVSIDYREGFHLYPFAQGLPAPAGTDAATIDLYNSYDGGVFAADTAEFIRAAYRAQQDMKGVIRFLKSRSLQDSSSNCKYFTGGFSAGAITALSAAFTDVALEKPPATGQLPNAVNPNWQNNAFQTPGPANKDDADYRSHNPLPFNYDAATCYQRPDLGNINGNMNITSGYDEKILGVVAMSGAIMDTTLFDQFVNRPAIYLYHVPGDEMVPFNTGHPLHALGNTFSPSPSAYAPLVYGSNWIWNKLNRISYPAPKRKLFYTDPLPPSTSPHNILPDLLPLCDSVALFFSEVLQANASCTPEFTDTFTFNGNGNWNVPANWLNNRVPVSPVSAAVHIIISPQTGGSCILNVPVTISSTAQLTVVPGAIFNISGNLVVQ
ncbi:MAG: carboxylesterase family protein [Chitinophagaceae bacterium]|nr:carboxylesterase family protein [Chitinophagaceae bacterium]